MEKRQIYFVTDMEETSAGVSLKLTGEDGSTVDLLISHDSYKKQKCKVGDSITDEEADCLVAAAELNRAVSRTVKILSYSDHSKSQLVKKLVAYGFSKEISLEATEEAVRLGYVNEKEQATRAATYYAKNKYWGKKRIAAELLVRGYERTAALAALSSVTEDEYKASLKHVIKRKYLPLPDAYDARMKMMSSLSRLGYSSGEINAAIEEITNEE